MAGRGRVGGFRLAETHNIYEEVNHKTDLEHVFLDIRHDVDNAKSATQKAAATNAFGCKVDRSKRIGEVLSCRLIELAA